MMKPTAASLFPSRFTLSNGYPEASHPYGQPINGRTVWHVSSIARKDCPPGALFPSLPVSAWTVTRYDDKPRAYHVKHCADFSPVHFTARSLVAALAGIVERCDESGAPRE